MDNGSWDPRGLIRNPLTERVRGRGGTILSWSHGIFFSSTSLGCVVPCWTRPRCWGYCASLGTRCPMGFMHSHAGEGATGFTVCEPFFLFFFLLFIFGWVGGMSWKSSLILWLYHCSVNHFRKMKYPDNREVLTLFYNFFVTKWSSIPICYFNWPRKQNGIYITWTFLFQH